MGGQFFQNMDVPEPPIHYYGHIFAEIGTHGNIIPFICSGQTTVETVGRYMHAIMQIMLVVDYFPSDSDSFHT